jgi:hypothetical protein
MNATWSLVVMSCQEWRLCVTNHRWNTCICNYSKDRIYVVTKPCSSLWVYAETEGRLLDDQDCCSQMNHMHFTTIPKPCSSSWVYVEFVGTHKGYRQKLQYVPVTYKYKLGHRGLQRETRERPLPHFPHTTQQDYVLLLPSIKIQDHYRYNDYLEAFNQ